MREFIALMAALMASNAIAIDTMLPALPAIGAALDVAEENRRQLVITSYLLGFGAGQLFYGPLSDRFGRKALLVGSLLFYGIFALLSGIAASFTLLLAARALQGVAAAGTRVLVISIIRDRYEGTAMARVMSLVMIVFMIVPVLAPAFGQAIIALGNWRQIFILLAVYSTILLTWTALRMPETLPRERRRALSFGAIGSAVATILKTRQSIGNTIVLTCAIGALFAFINSVQQIVSDFYGRPEMLALVFALIAGPMAISSYANSRLVRLYGPRRILLRALIGFSAISFLHLVSMEWIGTSLVTFIIIQSATMACFGLMGANASALAMGPLGHIAGTASSVQGVITTVGGALIGLAIGQSFDGTPLALLLGFPLLGAIGFAFALWANPRQAETAA
jgi:DHA1 family bicyclomycin/chloramphenicol resistance-like MFS transporter